jgi:hypothetical protein
MKKLLALLLLTGCVSVSYDSTILPPGSSVESKSEVGFGPYKSLLESYSINSEHVYVTPFIPLNHQAKFRECYGLLPEDEEIYAFINETISFGIDGYGCNGGVFTSKGLHVNAGSLADYIGKAFIPYSTLYSSNTSFVANLSMNINEKASLDLHVDDSVKKMRDVFVTARNRSKLSQYKNEVILKDEIKIKELPDSVLTFFNDFQNTNFYSKPNIPEYKESTFRKCSYMKNDEDIYILFDNTFFGGSSCIGFAFTSSGIYFTNPAESRYPGAYFLSYDHLLLSEFSPYIKKGTWNQGWNEVYVAPGISFYVFEMIPEDFLTILRALRGEEDITNDEALEFLATYERIPATIVAQNKVKTSKPANNISSERVKPNKAKKEGVDWGKVGWALLGLAVAKAIYEEIDDGPSYSSSNDYSYSRNESSTEYGQRLLERQQKINSQRQRQNQALETFEALANSNIRSKGDTSTAYLKESSIYTCTYVIGSQTYSLDRGISSCPLNIQIPMNSGLFDSNQMNYSSPSSIKTTWYLDSSYTNACIYKYGASTRSIPKGSVGMCPLSYDF